MMKSTIEIWRDIKDYEGRYKVSNLGRVRSVHRFERSGSGFREIKPKILALIVNKKGYKTIGLSDNIYKHSTKLVHFLVAQAFIPNPENKPCIDHINTNPSDNRVENLRWVTHKENQNNPLTKEHIRNGLKGYARSEEFKRKVSTSMKGMNSGKDNPMYGKLGKDNHCSKPILQYTLDDVFIKEWSCARDVYRELGIQYQNIGKCCLGIRNNAGGYKWKFKQ